MEIIDITKGIFSSEIYPGDPKPSAENFKSIENGDDCNLNGFFACAHTGTHVDAPLHFLEGGKTIDQIEIGRFVGPCRVIEVPEGPITGEYVEEHFPRSVQRVLVKSSGKAWFLDHGAYAAVNLDYCLIGTDSLSVGCEGNQIEPHRAFLRNNVAILEGLDLTDVKPGKYFLFAPPLKIEGLEAAPARAILIKDAF